MFITSYCGWFCPITWSSFFGLPDETAAQIFAIVPLYACLDLQNACSLPWINDQFSPSMQAPNPSHCHWWTGSSLKCRHFDCNAWSYCFCHSSHPINPHSQNNHRTHWGLHASCSRGSLYLYCCFLADYHFEDFYLLM